MQIVLVDVLALEFWEKVQAHIQECPLCQHDLDFCPGETIRCPIGQKFYTDWFQENFPTDEISHTE
jgi:hypothetical protein